jgi:phage tail sheath protein FI
MSTYTYPGVYIQELPSAVHTITGVATSIAAFIGWATQGPTDRAVLVESWTDFQQQFGGLTNSNGQPNYLGYAVNQFFGNGGQQAYIVRIVWSDSVTAKAAGVGGLLDLYATNPGQWGNNLAVSTTAQPGNPNRFSLQVLDTISGNVLESFVNLSTTATDPQYVVTVIDSDSQYLTFGSPPPKTNITPPAGPVQNAPTTAPTGGTLAANTYFYRVSALFGAVESAPSNELSIPTTGTTSANTISWTAAAPYLSQPPTGYKIYRGTAAGAENGYYTVAGTALTFVDTGAVPSAGAPSPSIGIAPLSGGVDGSALVPASDGNFEIALGADPSASNDYGLHLLDRVDIFNLLCVPGETDIATIQFLQEYCYNKRAFYIVDAPQLATTSQLNSLGPAGTMSGGTLTGNGALTGRFSMNSAYYYPWVQAPDPLYGNRLGLFPPCGFVAGIYASTDAQRGVWKAPAGIDASLTGVLGLQYILTDLENGDLNTQAINCLRQFKVYGKVVWGARTLQGNDHAGSQWKYVPIRRLALFLESSLYDGTQWVVFEPNDETLWSQIRLNVGAFLQVLFQQGAFQGTTPQQAYFVKCDAENNPQSSINQGVVNILVGFAPLYPAEFVVIQIQQMAGQVQTT